MPIEIRTLTDTSVLDVYKVFTEAFKNYLIPITFDENATLRRWELAGVRYDLSFGAFVDSRLVGLVLQTQCGDTLYNFCTGVIPEFRGKNIIESIYKRIYALSGYKKDALEVIKENSKAYNLYKKLGFTQKRELLSFQGALNIVAEEDSSLSYIIGPLQYSEEMHLIKMFNPALENSSLTTQKNIEAYELHEIRKEDRLMAYAIFAPVELSLKELGVTGSLEDNLDQLFFRMKLNNEKLRIMNVDEKAKDFMEYMMTRGLQHFITQYEMIHTR